ncbi:glycosyltransferase 87 family protein [Actinokineospora inagensis]|uniref:glycosyltransferase 87 family protein n=1 Tax=Actinokineospora inagensis TaxID=103730 RepID=UPI000408A1C8|nr:glycosyltransferase 87 family protein [Actinokineospora inagensis]
MQGAPARRSLWLDIAIYGGGAVFAVVTAIASEFYGYRVWGNCATVGYLVAVALTARIITTGRGSRWVPVWVVAALGAVAPLLYLAFRRAPNYVWGPWPWSFPAQPEVWVIERSAGELFAHGNPYIDLTALGRPPTPDDYTPYGPAMTVFGFPRALFGDHPLTDARVAFLVVTAAALLLAWRVLGRPNLPVRAAHLVVASPLTVLTLAVAGDDIAVVALVVLATAVAYRPGAISPWWTGALCAVLVTMKFTALPAAAVLAVGIAATRGVKAFGAAAVAFAAVGSALVLPVLLADPTRFVEHVVKFPVGLGRASSPASSPLPGHLLASLGPAGHTTALVLLGLAAAATATWVLVRPPRTAADAVLRTAVGLGAAIVLAPATRWGYLVYPVVLLGAAIGFAAANRVGTGVSAPAERSSVDGTPRDKARPA